MHNVSRPSTGGRSYHGPATCVSVSVRPARVAIRYELDQEYIGGASLVCDWQTTICNAGATGPMLARLDRGPKSLAIIGRGWPRLAPCRRCKPQQTGAKSRPRPTIYGCRRSSEATNHWPRWQIVGICGSETAGPMICGSGTVGLTIYGSGIVGPNDLWLWSSWPNGLRPLVTLGRRCGPC
jgi:hypothetical protein